MGRKRIEYRDPATLTPYENNPRDNEASVPRVKASIQEFHFQNPILVDPDGVVIAGHTRLKAALELGLSEVPVVVVDDLTPEQVRAYRLADNKAGEASEWLDAMLAEELAAIEGMDMSALGFENEAVDFTDLESMMGEKDDAYNEFVDKFKPKHTTDDCFTPPEVYEAVKAWALARYGHKGEIVRPFYPGGDYKAFRYPKGCLVLDNPPFSIQAEICRFYVEKGIDFFLFANGLTVLNSLKEGAVHAVVAHANIIYENGADINTSFVTNLGDEAIVVSGSLHDAVEEAQPRETADLNYYAYPDNLVTSAILGRLAYYGAEFTIPNVRVVSKLDDGTAVYGKGALISDMAAEKVKAEKEKVKAEKERIPVELSERERERDRGGAEQDGGDGMNQIVMMDPADLTPYENNPRDNDGAVEAVANSIREFGFKAPIIVDRDHVIIAGHTRLKAALALGLESVPVIVADDLTEEQVKAYRLADNRTGEIATWLEEALAQELAGIGGIDMSEFGFDVQEAADIGEWSMEGDPDELPEEPDPDAPPRTKRGQVWRLGEHRLMCGDSADEKDVARLMKGERADMAFTDPPWNVAYDREIMNDDMDEGLFLEFIDKAVRNLSRSLTGGGHGVYRHGHRAALAHHGPAREGGPPLVVDDNVGQGPVRPVPQGLPHEVRADMVRVGVQRGEEASPRPRERRRRPGPFEEGLPHPLRADILRVEGGRAEEEPADRPHPGRRMGVRQAEGVRGAPHDEARRPGRPRHRELVRVRRDGPGPVRRVGDDADGVRADAEAVPHDGAGPQVLRRHNRQVGEGHRQEGRAHGGGPAMEALHIALGAMLGGFAGSVLADVVADLIAGRIERRRKG